MVSVIVRRSKIRGSLRCPSSKSYTHRAIAVSSLAGSKTSVITNALLGRDTLATLASCQALGAEIRQTGTTLEVRGRRELGPPENVINAENSGTTIRILAAISGLVRTGYVVLTGDDSLRKRPMPEGAYHPSKRVVHFLPWPDAVPPLPALFRFRRCTKHRRQVFLLLSRL